MPSATVDLLAALEPELRHSHTSNEALVKALRQRQFPRTGFTQELVARVRNASSDEQIAKARNDFAAAFDKPLVAGAHTNTFTQLGDVTLMQAVDAAAAERLGAFVLDSRELWDQGPWGITGSITRLLRVLMAIPDVSDAALVPIFGWLTAQQPAEWNWSRTWEETMLDTAGHNWWLHTYVGYFQAGMIFPEFQGMRQFQAFAPDYLEHELAQVFAADGFTRERSGYHWGTVTSLLHGYTLARLNGITFSERFHAHLRQVGETLWQTATPNGFVPCFGDVGNHHIARSPIQLRTVAAMLQLPAAKAVAEAIEPEWEPPLGMLLFDGEDLLPAYRRLTAQTPPPDCALTDSGFYFTRSSWQPDADYLAFQAGEIGSIVSSHAHTDMFTFELYSHGRPVIIDNCSGPYGTDPSRLWRVSSAAHNVATIDGKDHIPMQNEWRWDRQLQPHVTDWISADTFAYVNAAHEGYRWLDEPVEAARRKLFHLRDGYIIMLDRFTPANQAEHTYTLHFHIDGPHELRDDGRLLTTAPAGNLLMVPVPGHAGEAAIEPCPHPLDDYDNPDHLTYTRTAAEPLLLATLLVPFAGTTAPEVAVEVVPVEADGRRLSPWEATGLRICVDGVEHYYLDQHMQWNLPWQIGPHSGHSRLFHSAVHS